MYKWRKMLTLYNKAYGFVAETTCSLLYFTNQKATLIIKVNCHRFPHTKLPIV